mmetsp:Transcript_12563/g.29736  ORF Transcript_12563/g.29736 Transcript_12563/m.29736 type:complete len:688 (-) Transcript_12563:183-2246(-)
MSLTSMTFDQTFITAVGISSVVMVCSGLWIIRVLIQIEKSKVVALSSVLEDDGTGNSDLQFEESTSESNGKQLEVESADGSPSGGDIELSPTGSSRIREKAKANTESASPAKPITARRARRKLRRVSWTFINIQIVSVLALILLTYLLMVQSTAAVFLRMLGSLCVFAVFLRFQIGEEIRRQRVDRIMLLLSLFLLIASMLSTLVYSMKQLKQGEIYEGPARIVGYSKENYNNTKHDPTTRTDIAVSWGKDWGCPLSGGIVCQANVEGAMCQSHPDKEQTKHKPHYDTRRNRNRFLEDKSDEDERNEEEQKEEETEEVEEALEEDLEDEEKSNQELEEENEDLSEENAMLQKEIEELKEENEVEDEENNEIVAQENSELDEIADEYNEDIMIVEEEEYEDAQAYVDYEYEEEEESLEDQIESATDDEVKEELNEEEEEDQEDQDELDEEYEEDEELLEEYAEEYADLADEDYDEFANEQDNTIAFDEEKEEIEEEVEETEDEIEDNGYSSSSNGGDDSTTDDIYEEMAEDVYDEEEEEIEEEYEEAYYDEDDWYWDEYPSYYDDDYYEDEYWNYDWESIWGDYACEDLFDADISGQSYDPNTPAGGDDEWPFVNIYGSCKTCEAYILDYFAEEAFEETQEFKQQAIVYLAGAVSGFIWALLSYIKYKVLPTSENEIELLGTDGGVLA